MDCQNMDLIYHSEAHCSRFERSEKGQIWVFFYLLAIFLTLV